MQNNPHCCSCIKVHECPIMVHPDKNIQKLLADLSEAMAIYDEKTKSKSQLIFHTDRYDGGTFHSITENTGSYV